MDGDPVDGEPSEPMSLVDVLVKLCPSYMAMGMTYDEYWHSNTAHHKAIREEYKIRKHNEEWARWRQGAYFYDALLRVAPVIRAAFGKGKVEPGKYPDQPWPLTEKEAREQEEARERENYFKAIAQRKAASEQRKQQRRMEAAMKEASKDGRDD